MTVPFLRVVVRWETRNLGPEWSGNLGQGVEIQPVDDDARDIADEHRRNHRGPAQQRHVSKQLVEQHGGVKAEIGSGTSPSRWLGKDKHGKRGGEAARARGDLVIN